MQAALTKDLEHFIRECIDRLETLEVLLLLQSTGGRTWTVAEISREMRSSPLAAESALGVLLARGLIAKQEDTYTFRPIRPELEEKTIRLAACYRERRTAVIAVIFSRPSDAVRSFADAFRIKRGGSDG